MSILFNIEGQVARITIDRPDRMNAVDREAHKRLVEIWDEIDTNPNIRCAVLTGSGERAFCAGADLKDDSGLSGVEYWEQLGADFGGISLRKNLSKPVIARVNGLALGGGFEMVLGCDIIVAADNARFGLPEAKVGRLPLDGGMVTLPRLMPRNIAVGMMMTGRMVPALQMAQYGLLNAVVTFDDLDAEVDRWVSDILAAAPLSVQAIKATVRRTAHLDTQAAYNTRLPELIAALESVDAEEGVLAFREKRAPVWKGQ
ncbi:enoyl-CoA hydratase-related protein [Ahrensia kielensis]|uniref:Enoyl-CoA hydratase-related protein n=1 Tax=Ahrensia kielensis TaxID=76980 RepID=A0ABU9TB71_9HYPH